MFQQQDNRRSDALKNSLADFQFPAVVTATPSVSLNLFVYFFGRASDHGLVEIFSGSFVA